MPELEILHLATTNIAGIPLRLVQAERAAGWKSLLVTLSPSAQGFDDELCLNAPWSGALQHRIGCHLRGIRQEVRRRNEGGVPRRKPDPWYLAGLSDLRDRLWLRMLDRAVPPAMRDQLKLVVLHGGRGTTRGGIEVRRGLDRGIPLVIFYYGQDLRLLGADPFLDSAAASRFTFQFDHTLFDPSLHYLYYPFDFSVLPPRRAISSLRPRVGHAPTRRDYKSSDLILSVLTRLEREGRLELLLIEGYPHAEALALKSTCDLFVDQITDLGGYGVNTVEALGMGIPVMVGLKPDREAFLGQHPLLGVSPVTLEPRLRDWLERWDGRREPCGKCIAWVKERHTVESVVAGVRNAVGSRLGAKLAGWPL